MKTVVSLRPNPSDGTRARSGSELWARASTSDGRSVTGRLTTPNSYDLTADAIVRVVRALVDGSVAPGSQTPSTALGAGFVETLDGVTVTPPVRAD